MNVDHNHDPLTEPYAVINELYDKSRNSDLKKGSPFGVKEHYEGLLAHPSFVNRLQYLPNVFPVLKSGTVVRYRGLVQDVYDPEFYCSEYAKIAKDGSRSYMSSKYRDDLDGEDLDNIDDDSVKMLERDVFLCIPVPGESEWVTSNAVAIAGGAVDTKSSEGDRKRPASEVLSDNSKVMRTHALPLQGEGSSLQSATGAGASDPFDALKALNVKGKGCCCLTKIYDTDGAFHLNDMIEIIGIYTYEAPTIPESTTSRGPLDQLLDFNTSEMDQLQYPMPHIAPRLHALTARRIGSSFPLLMQVPTNSPLHPRTSTCHRTLQKIIRGGLGGARGGREPKMIDESQEVSDSRTEEWTVTPRWGALQQFLPFEMSPQPCPSSIHDLNPNLNPSDKNHNHSNFVTASSTEEGTTILLDHISTREEVSKIRARIITILTHALQGDVLAAEYLLLCCLSSVSHRADGMCLGGIVVNLHVNDQDPSDSPMKGAGTETDTSMSSVHTVSPVNIGRSGSSSGARGNEVPGGYSSSSMKVVSLLASLQQVLSSIAPRCVTLPIDLTSLNRLSLLPEKDYASNSMGVSSLQVGAGTVLLLNACSTAGVTAAPEAKGKDDGDSKGKGKGEGDEVKLSVGRQGDKGKGVRFAEEVLQGSGKGGEPSKGGPGKSKEGGAMTMTLNERGQRSLLALKSVLWQQQLPVQCGFSEVKLPVEVSSIIITNTNKEDGNGKKSSDSGRDGKEGKEGNGGNEGSEGSEGTNDTNSSPCSFYADELGDLSAVLVPWEPKAMGTSTTLSRTAAVSVSPPNATSTAAAAATSTAAATTTTAVDADADGGGMVYLSDDSDAEDGDETPIDHRAHISGLSGAAPVPVPLPAPPTAPALAPHVGVALGSRVSAMEVDEDHGQSVGASIGASTGASIGASSIGASSGAGAEEQVDGCLEVEEAMRMWWAALRLMEITMSEEVRIRAENDYVTARSSSSGDGTTTTTTTTTTSSSSRSRDARPVRATDFHTWLGLVRLLALSYGDQVITVAHWEQMLLLEDARQDRVYRNKEGGR